MKNFFTETFEYWKNVAHGEEYISDVVKFTYLLEAAAGIHVVLSIFFGFFNNFAMMLYHIVAFLLYLYLFSVAKKRRFVFCIFATAIEVNVSVMISAILFGTALGFNLYSLTIIPMIFYCTSTVKDFKKPVVTAVTVSAISSAVYILSNFFQKVDIAAITNNNNGLAIAAMIINPMIVTLFFIIFLLLFTWEVRNNTAALESRNQQLKQISTKDPLTKLNNRRSMTEHLNLSMSQMRQTKKPFSVILCDIDNFKHVNDTYGHDCGDKVLVMVANIVSAQMRESDFVCRWGGEEILIKVEGSQKVAKAIAERIRVTIYGSEVEHEGTKVNVTMTFGVAEANPNQRVEDFIQLADNRLYYGKEHGKNQVVTEIPTGY